MKVLIIAAVLVALSSASPAGAPQDPRLHGASNQAATTVIADAGRIGSASLTALNGGSHWEPAQVQADSEFGAAAPELDTGMLLGALVGLVIALYRPLGRALRRQEQQRRAAALASTLDHAPRG